MDPVESAVKYAEWLLENGKAREAMGVVQGVRGDVEREEVERRWRVLLDENAKKQGEKENEDEAGEDEDQLMDA